MKSPIWSRSKGDLRRTTLRRITVLAGRLRITIAGNRLRVRVDDGDELSTRLPAGTQDLNDFDALSWATLAATVLAHKQLGHTLPQKVREALEVVAVWAHSGDVLDRERI